MAGLEWHGDEIIRKMKAAEKSGLLDTDAAVIEEAGRRVRVASGDLQADIDIIQPPTATGDGFTSLVGSQNLAYAAIQELGPADGRPYGYTPYMRPSLDIEGPKLADRIKTNFGA